MLVAAGWFTDVNGVAVNHVAAWDGRQWTDWGAGADSVSDLVVHQINGAPALVGCGSFFLEDQGGTTTDVAYWDGSAWSGFPAINMVNQDAIGPMYVWDNGDGDGPALHVAVTIEWPDSGDSHDSLWRLDPSMQRWDLIGGTYEVPISRISSRVAWDEDSSGATTFFVGGRFEWINGIYSDSLARILPQPEGGATEPLPSDPRALRGYYLRSLATLGDGSVVAAGRFRGISHDEQTVVAHFNGEYWGEIAWGGYGSTPVSTLKVLDDGSGPALYAAGSFTSVYPNNGEIPLRIARWDGLNWIRMGLPPDGVTALCVHDDGSGPAIYIACDGAVRKWNPGSGTWLPIGPTMTGGGYWGPGIYAIASFDDGSGPALYISGNFETVNGASTNYVARWRGPSKGWSGVGNGLPNPAEILHVHDDGVMPRLIADVGLGPSGNLAQWDGQAWSGVGNLVSIGLGNAIEAMTTLDDGSGPALIVSNYGRTGRWNGSSWSLVANQGAEALVADGNVLYMGSPFSIWAPGGDELSVGGLIGGGSFEPGNSVALQVNAIHGGAVTFQWLRNGVPLMNGSGYSGTLTSRLSVYNLNGSHEGVYDVVVSNDCTSVVSDVMQIDVIGTCMGDITVDNIVDVNDLIAVITDWGSCVQYQPCPADITHDGAVNADDLIAVILRWGDCS